MKPAYTKKHVMALIRGRVWLVIPACCFLFLETESATIDYNQPILPANYQNLIGNGFAVKYFSKTGPLLDLYEPKNIQDVYDAGFRNLRLRCNAWYYEYPYDDQNFTDFLNAMEKVVDRMFAVGVTPIISWSDPDATNFGTEDQRISYLAWWETVAKRLKDKDYRLSFNLVTELNRGHCKDVGDGDCSGSLRENKTKFNIWMDQVIDKIRETGGKNTERILILGPPQYSARGIKYINKTLFDDYMMVEFHIYAGGPTKKEGRQYWEGNGTATQRQTLLDELKMAENDTTLPKYFGAWMPIDNKGGSINQTEGENFARFFVSTLKDWEIPWSLNALEVYYNTDNSTWLTGLQDKAGLWLNMSRILDVIKDCMKPE